MLQSLAAGVAGSTLLVTWTAPSILCRRHRAQCHPMSTSTRCLPICLLPAPKRLVEVIGVGLLGLLGSLGLLATGSARGLALG